MMSRNCSPASVLKLVWLLVCLGLMAWQIYRCTSEFYNNPVVTSINREKFTDDFLPQITVCPKAKFNGQEVKQEELARHGLDMASYLDHRNITWKSKNSSDTAEEVLASITWGIEDLVSHIGQAVVGEVFNGVKIRDTLPLWTPTIWHATTMMCYKLDLRKFKKGNGRLERLILWSKFPGGMTIFLHKTDQVFDKSLRLEIRAGHYNYNPRADLERTYDVSMKEIKTLSTGQHPCSTGSFDKKMLKIATDKMMMEVGCVVPFVDQVEGTPICSGGKDAIKAFDIYNEFFNSFGLYEREGVAPPCEYFETTAKETRQYVRKDINHNYTIRATLKFSTQVEVFEQLAKYSWLNYLAEVGGYLGLLLGYSLYNLSVLCDYCPTSGKTA